MYQRVDTFRQAYRAYSFTFSNKPNPRELNHFGKILLPPSSLLVMSNLTLIYPLTFVIHKRGIPENLTHCGVLEFTANEGQCNLPRWMMNRLNLEEGDYVNVNTLALPKASFIRFKPRSVEFFQIPNYRVVMERSLVNYSAITLGDVISIGFNNKEYLLEVAECKPGGTAVSIVETDVTVDFDGNHLPENQPDVINVDSDSDEESENLCFGGNDVQEEETSSSDDSFVPFCGVGHTLRESAQENQSKWKDEDWG
ncbi:Ubiquitin fusion degradation protein [Entamoeba marina]